MEKRLIKMEELLKQSNLRESKNKNIPEKSETKRRNLSDNSATIHRKLDKVHVRRFGYPFALKL